MKKKTSFKVPSNEINIPTLLRHRRLAGVRNSEASRMNIVARPHEQHPFGYQILHPPVGFYPSPPAPGPAPPLGQRILNSAESNELQTFFTDFASGETDTDSDLLDKSTAIKQEGRILFDTDYPFPQDLHAYSSGLAGDDWQLNGQQHEGHFSSTGAFGQDSEQYSPTYGHSIDILEAASALSHPVPSNPPGQTNRSTSSHVRSPQHDKLTPNQMQSSHHDHHSPIYTQAPQAVGIPSTVADPTTDPFFEEAVAITSPALFSPQQAFSHAINDSMFLTVPFSGNHHASHPEAIPLNGSANQISQAPPDFSLSHFSNPLQAEHFLSRPPISLPFGTDPAFASSRYAPAMSQGADNQVGRNLLGVVDCIDPNRQRADTYPLALEQRGSCQGNSNVLSDDPALHNQDSQQALDPPGMGALQRQDHEDLEHRLDDMFLFKGESDHSSRAKPKRKQKKKLPATKPKAQTRKRPNSGVRAKGKQSSRRGRTNLSDSEKRKNHILSEQRRRDIIKEGYHNLCQIVPGAARLEHSKSVGLAYAAKFIAEVRGDVTAMMQAIAQVHQSQEPEHLSAQTGFDTHLEARFP
ncbi:MAG: hypothetical protein M1814_005003 [Vezdaea aestivalis]|nr:MAG: hypothetical protein M1814_005003 [Vezdaea aestivalis]